MPLDLADVFVAQPLCQGGAGFAPFGSEHLAWLAVCLAIVAGVVLVWKWLPKGEGLAAPRRRLVLALSLVPVALLASDDLLMVATGTFFAPWWPLHVCNLAELVCVAHALAPCRLTRELLLTIGLSGSCAALLFPGWSYCPALSWPAVCGFLEHSLVLALSLLAVSDPLTSPRWADLALSCATVGAYAALFRWLNPILGADFGFVSGAAANSPLEAWQGRWGDPGYLVPYAATFLAVAVVLHAAV
ncbi:MAG: YwaF family protein, partial [Olsenella sp.]|nr:YwaF family protein [Olsenella sp.]